jgi:PKD domain
MAMSFPLVLHAASAPAPMAHLHARPRPTALPPAPLASPSPRAPAGTTSSSWTPVWTNVTNGSTPGFRADAGFTYDPKLGGLVLFGGATARLSASPGNDTWLFKNGSWTNLTAHLGGTPPSARYAIEDSFVYDPQFGGDVLVGGRSSNGAPVGGTYLLANGSWTDIGANFSSAPPALAYNTVTYDRADGYLVLFGGFDSSSSAGTSATWVLRTTGWTQLTPSTSPHYRWGGTMAYDASRGKVLLLGGRYDNLYGSIYFLNDTWVYSGGAWSQLTLSSSPPGEWLGTMTYVGSEGYVLSYGGCWYLGCLGGSNYTWLLVNDRWINITSLPELSSNPTSLRDESMAFDPVTNDTVLEGGVGPVSSSAGGHLNATWVFRWPYLNATFRANRTVLVNGSSVRFAASAVGGTFNYSYAYTGLPTNCSSGNASTFSCRFYGLGNFTVNATINDLTGANVTLSQPIEVAYEHLAPPAATVVPDPTEVGVPFRLSLAVSGGNASGRSYAYASLPPGCAAANAPSWSCTPTTAGVYNVTAQVRDPTPEAASTTATVTIAPRLAVSFGSPPTATDVGLPFALVAATRGGVGNLTLAWTQLPSACHVVGAGQVQCTALGPGVLHVEATANDSLGVTAVAQLNVTILPRPTVTVVAASFAGHPTYHFSVRADVAGGVAPYTYLWSWGDGTSSNSTIDSATHDFSLPGTYPVGVVVADAEGVRAETNVSVSVFALPTLSWSTFPEYPVVGASVTFSVQANGGAPPLAYAWSGLPGGCAPANSSTIACRPTAAGSAVVQVVATDALGTSIALSRTTLAVAPLAASAGTDAPIYSCSGSGSASVTFHASARGGLPPYAFAWTLPNGSSATGAAATTVLGLGAASYTVYLTATDRSNQSSSANASVAIQPPPCPSVSGGTTNWAEVIEIAAGIGAVVVVAVAVLTLRRARPPPPRYDEPAAEYSDAPETTEPDPAPVDEA